MQVLTSQAVKAQVMQWKIEINEPVMDWAAKAIAHTCPLED